LRVKFGAGGVFSVPARQKVEESSSKIQVNAKQYINDVFILKLIRFLSGIKKIEE
jgi:hypothetical protein